jgi:hypothetical protein
MYGRMLFWIGVAFGIIGMVPFILTPFLGGGNVPLLGVGAALFFAGVIGNLAGRGIQDLQRRIEKLEQQTGSARKPERQAPV